MEDLGLDFGKCYYKPSFFRMKIDLPIDMSNLNEIPDGAFSLYLHEYIHFIQDISTIYGLMNISTINYYIQDCANKIHKAKGKEFHPPISLVQKENDHGFNNFKLKPIYIGTSINPKSDKIKFLSYKIKPRQFGEKGETVGIVEVKFIDLKDDSERVIELGGNHICEGMAYLAESHIYKEVLKEHEHEIIAQEYPYLLVKKIAEKLYPKIAEDSLILIALCDICLMTYHPGLSYVRLLEHLRDKNFFEDHKLSENKDLLDKLYEFSYSFLKGNHVDFETLIEVVRGEIKKNFNDKYFNDNNKWIDILFDRIKDFRLKIPRFIVDMVYFGDPKNNELFGAFHQLVGSPLVLNSDYNATISLPKGFNPKNLNISLFWAINQVLTVFYSDQPKPCGLREYCKKSQEIDPKISVDERCDDKPWSRCNDENLCPFATIWKHWALCGNSPKYSGETR
ncbi:hypothetical protein [Parvicella tangerina]|uniref:Uncharacterized protein n=1 Tax=Parvicella tangerina TaxID=2829795 RepID=A0A916JKH4_9FLAO|nr:hypothetical protein [Parvicella tangerina]CAG5077621.1 hypothetical protein CRYO30217_00440 [Parvicella tangerina]